MTALVQRIRELLAARDTGVAERHAPTLLAQAADEIERLDSIAAYEMSPMTLRYVQRIHDEEQRADAAEARCRELETAARYEKARADANAMDCSRFEERIAELDEQLHRFQCGEDIESDHLCKAAMDLLASINRVSELEAALRRYGRHETGCHAWSGVPRKRTAQDCGPPPPPVMGPCTCGLDAALKGGE